MNNTHCISADQIEKFLAGEAEAAAAVRIESHLSRCNVCERKIESFKEVAAAMDGWTAVSHGDAWRRSDEEGRTASDNAAVDILGNAAKESFGALTELEKKRIEKWDREYAPPASALERNLSSDHDGEDFMLLAASMEPDREMSGGFGEALGVAVDEKTQKGAIISVSARVGNDIKEEGSVKIVGSQVEGRSRNGIGYQTTPPLQLLGERLRERFKAPALAPMAMHKRDVYIEIENTDYLSRAGSLMLTVIVAVINAVTGKGGFEDVVYSADVDLDGGLQGVGRIAEKADFVFSEGSHRFATASGDLHEIRAHLRETHAEDIVSFHDVSDLLTYLDIDIVAEQRGNNAISPPPSKRKYFGPIRTPALILGLLASGVMAFLAFSTGVFYAPADLMTLFSLHSGNSGWIEHGRIIDAGFWIFLITWLAALCMHAFATLLTRGEKATAFPRLKSMGKYPLEQTVLLLSLVYFGLNLHMFAGQPPEDFKRYERIEHLIHNDYFKDVTRDIPNYRYMEFEKRAAGRENDDLEEALRIGLEIRPSDPLFKKAFIEMTGLLMDRMNDMTYAKQLLGSYIQFVDSIREHPNAKPWVADTIDAAEDLMNQYKLKETFHGENRFGALIGEIVMRYGL